MKLSHTSLRAPFRYFVLVWCNCGNIHIILIILKEPYKFDDFMKKKINLKKSLVVNVIFRN